MPDKRDADRRHGPENVPKYSAPETDPIVASLRAAYDKTLAEPLPEALADLLRRLE